MAELPERDAALLECVFRIALENFAGRRYGDFPAAAIKQLGPNLFLERANLRGDRRLRAEAALRRARETAQARDFQERFELIEVHKGSNAISN